ncbi:MAG: AraC family transcriptional regulator [Lachnospiraceae bacterium]|nr:AraC family transcriptional regulator [Lachnospiraceae bacterium]
MQNSLKKIMAFVRSMELLDGYNATPLSYLSVYRTESKILQMPPDNMPYLFVVLDGSMHLYTPSGILDYVAGQYSVSSIDTPSKGNVLAFSENQDFCAFSISFNLNEVHEVMMEIDGGLAKQILDDAVPAKIMEQADKSVIDSIHSLLSNLDNTIQRDFMGRHIKREIIFQILCGPSGKHFLQSIVQIQQSGEIYELNSWIKENYRKPFSVEELAEKWNMSIPTLHQKFKSVVGMGLLQCQKRLRLTEAKRLMLDENKNVTEAALEVGYESISQFNREYKRMFGKPPKEDAQWLRESVKK